MKFSSVYTYQTWDRKFSFLYAHAYGCLLLHKVVLNDNLLLVHDDCVLVLDDKLQVQDDIFRVLDDIVKG